MNRHSTSGSRACNGRWKQTILVCLIGVTPLYAQSTGYTITTVAGNGIAGYAEGAATASVLSSPYAVAVDSAGNVYISDGGNQRIRKVTNGTISTVAGNGTAGYTADNVAATTSELNSPSGVALDSGGNMYIADTNNSLIRKVSSSGTITTFAGNINSGPGYVDATTATLGQLAFPSSVAVDATGNVYISESAFGNNRIRKVDTTGALTTIANNSTGAIGSSGDNGPATAAHLNNPTALAVDKAGNLYIADAGNHKIRRIDAATGIITTVAGIGGAGGFSGDGGPAKSAQLNSPTGVSVDALGNLYIADKLNFRVRMVTAATGIITTIAGKSSSGYSGDGGQATDARLQFPTGTAVDSAGNVYVADNQNSAIRQLTPPAPLLPAIPTGGVISAGAYGAFPSIAPGSWIEIYGTNLAADTNGWGSLFVGVNAPTTIDRTSVSIGGQSAFLDYISPGQVNAQVPSNVSTGTQQIVVTTVAGASPAYSVTVNAAQPGMRAPPSFLIGGKQYVAAQFTDGVTYVLPPNAIPGLPSRQAKPGETIVIYGIGFGSVTPAIPAGQIVQQNNSLALPLQVSIGGAPATLGYDGLVQTYIGLYQFNVVVPSIADNDAAPLTFTLGGAPGAQTLYTAVKN